MPLPTLPSTTQKWTMAEPKLFAKRRMWLHAVEERYGDMKKHKGRTREDCLTYR